MFIRILSFLFYFTGWNACVISYFMFGGANWSTEMQVVMGLIGLLAFICMLFVAFGPRHEKTEGDKSWIDPVGFNNLTAD